MLFKEMPMRNQMQVAAMLIELPQAEPLTEQDRDVIKQYVWDDRNFSDEKTDDERIDYDEGFMEPNPLSFLAFYEAMPFRPITGA